MAKADQNDNEVLQNGRLPSSSSDEGDSKEEKDEDCFTFDDVSRYIDRRVGNLSIALCIFITLAYLLGSCGLSPAWVLLLLVAALWQWRHKTKEMYSFLCHEAELREHRRRAFSQAETVEWFNFLINRWWIFSDRTLFELMKTGLDPVLLDSKPNIVDTIELTDFTVGNRTPYFKYVRVYDTIDEMRKQMATEVTFRNPPGDLLSRPKYHVIMDMDMALDAPDSRCSILVKLWDKLGHMRIVVEGFQIRGRVQVVLHFNQNIAFPHLAAFSISFLHEPKVAFQVRLLQKFQLMEFPYIRNWITQLVEDSLKLSLVDPGRVTIPLCNDPEVVGRRAGYACGVITLTLKGGLEGRINDHMQWCSITLEKKKIRMKEIENDIVWQEQMSFLVKHLQYDKLVVKIKGKRAFGTSYTLVEYVLPLVRMNLEHQNKQHLELQDSNIRGSLLHLNIEYTPLALLDLDQETEWKEFNSNYIDKFAPMVPTEVAGILFVRVHSGSNLIPMDSDGLSDPYFMLFSNCDLVHLSPVIDDTLNPQWDSMVEFFTPDYTQTTLSFIIHDRNPVMFATAFLSDDNDDFMGSCNIALEKDDWLVFKREVDVYFKLSDALKRSKAEESMKRAGKICVSIVFRPAPSIAASVPLGKNEGLPLGEPLQKKQSRMDAVTLEALLCAERGSLSISIFRGKDLAVMDLTGKSDPFVTIKIGEERIEKYKTKTMYRTLNPVWNEQVTFAMPLKAQLLYLEVWDKDPFGQEKMGMLTFSYSELLHLGEMPDEKLWHKLQNTRRGEIQLSFKVEMPSSEADDLIPSCDVCDAPTNPSSCHISEADGISIDQYEIIEDETGSTSAEHLLHNHQHNVAADEVREKEVEKIPSNETEQGKVVDLSKEPTKYFGIYGELLQVTGLYAREGVSTFSVKARFDSRSKKSGIFGHNPVLFRSPILPIGSSMTINHSFSLKADQGVSPCTYLSFEVKDERKDVIDSKAVLLRSLMRGGNPVTKWVELENGGKLQLKIGHKRETTPISRRRIFTRSKQLRKSIQRQSTAS